MCIAHVRLPLCPHRSGSNRVVERSCPKSRRIRPRSTRPASDAASSRRRAIRRTSSLPCRYRAAYRKSTGSPAEWRCCASSTTDRVELNRNCFVLFFIVISLPPLTRNERKIRRYQRRAILYGCGSRELGFLGLLLYWRGA